MNFTDPSGLQVSNPIDNVFGSFGGGFNDPSQLLSSLYLDRSLDPFDFSTPSISDFGIGFGGGFETLIES